MYLWCPLSCPLLGWVTCDSRNPPLVSHMWHVCVSIGNASWSLALLTPGACCWSLWLVQAVGQQLQLASAKLAVLTIIITIITHSSCSSSSTSAWQSMCWQFGRLCVSEQLTAGCCSSPTIFLPGHRHERQIGCHVERQLQQQRNA